MSAQKRETKKNFIAIVSEAAEERRAVDRPVKTDEPARRSFLGLMAAVLNRDIDAKPLSNQSSPAGPCPEFRRLQPAMRRPGCKTR
ncbi:MAG TPA: hypothetical protein VGM09_24475 [Bradyrhizobium sp.]